MTTVHIEYSSTLATAVGAREEVCQLEALPPTIASLLETLRGRHGDKLVGRLFTTEGDLLPSVLASVNDSQVADPSHELVDGDRVLWLSVVGGG